MQNRIQLRQRIARRRQYIQPNHGWLRLVTNRDYLVCAGGRRVSFRDGTAQDTRADYPLYGGKPTTGGGITLDGCKRSGDLPVVRVVRGRMPALGRLSRRSGKLQPSGKKSREISPKTVIFTP
jgi:hypothetical protein